MSQAITKQMNYTTKPSAPKGRRFTRSLNSLGNNPSSGYSMSDEITFYIPAGNANQVWDGQTAYLNFILQLQLTAGGGDVAANAQSVRFDYTASSIINRIDVYGSGDQVIETISNYAALANLLYDTQLSQSDAIGLSTMIGTTDGDGTVANNRLGVSLTNSATVTDGNTGTTSFEFSIPILSSVFALSEKYFPAYLCSSDFKVVITLNSQAHAFVIPVVNNSTVVCKILNPQIKIDYIELDPSAIQQMNSVFSGGEVVLHSSSYRNYTTTIADATSGSWNAILPAKQMSCKAIFTIFRTIGTTGVAAGYTQSSRTNPFTGASSWFAYQIGGERYPQKPLQSNVSSGVSEFHSELSKALHAYGDLQMNGVLSRQCYTSASTVAANNLPSIRGFAIGLNTSQVRGADDVILSGLDLSKVTTYLEANFTTAIAGQQTVDTYLYHDMLIVIDQNGNVSSKM